MESAEFIPFDPGAQRALERHWLHTVRDRQLPEQVRHVVRESWERSLQAEIRPDLPRAPVLLDSDSLEVARQDSGWYQLAQQVLEPELIRCAGQGHIVTLFDDDVRMLSADGDPAALEGLFDINFRPGALWSEGAVGTNGPGTALATGAATHIVGAEHFCAGWHRWHCAAVPIREDVTGRILGVLDISGFRERAHPHTLHLAAALALAVERSLAARDAERRCLTLTHLSQLNARYPGDVTLAVDRHGIVLSASANVPRELSVDGATAELRRLCAGLVREGRDGAPRQVMLPAARGARRQAVWYPVLEGRQVIGGCMVVARPGLPAGSRSASRSAASRPAGTRYTFTDVLGASAALVEARQAAFAAAGSDVPVLLLGESGTGKEVFAQAIHHASERRHRPFIAVNCAALPRDLIESELFGYTGGAFSGARPEGRIGKFEAAEGGTLFLDEIGELSPPAQAALLRALQEGEVTRVGAVHGRPVNVRVIAATNRDVGVALAQGHLRADLYYRLSVMPIELPALRARPEDIALLAHHFFEAAARDLGRLEVVVEPEVISAFCTYHWPGNIRELKNVVRRLMVVSGNTVRLTDVPLAVRASYLGIDPPAQSLPAEVQVEPVSRLDEEDARLIAIVNSSPTMAEAAARLGITRSTLYRRMERFGLRPRRVVDRA